MIQILMDWYYIPKTVETISNNLIAGALIKHSLQFEYIIIQSIKSANI